MPHCIDLVMGSEASVRELVETDERSLRHKLNLENDRISSSLLGKYLVSSLINPG